MCGRFYLDSPTEYLQEVFNVESSLLITPRFNIAPTQKIIVVRHRDHVRELVQLRWGLIPSWSKEAKSNYSMINARAETVAEKPAYRAAFKKRRCLIPASGFYEWKPDKSGKQPYAICKSDGSLMAFAGLWEHWEGDSDVIESCSIIVTEANDQVRTVHDRMPVILQPDTFNQWLDEEATADGLQDLLLPSSVKLDIYPVSKKVNSPSYDSAELLQHFGS